MRWERRPRDITVSKLTKLMVMFLKENGLYMKFYNHFMRSKKGKKFCRINGGFIKYLNSVVKNEHDWLESCEVYFDEYFISEIMFPLSVVAQITGYRSHKDIDFFYDYVKAHFRELNYFNGRVIPDG